MTEAAFPILVVRVEYHTDEHEILDRVKNQEMLKKQLAVVIFSTALC